MLADEKVSLSKARFLNAKECLEDARLLAEGDRCKSLVNRSYYAIFHAMRAVLVLDEFDGKKHSGIIAEFRKQYIKTGVFQTKMSAVITKLFLARTNSDYDDFYVISKADAVVQFHMQRDLSRLLGNTLKKHIRRHNLRRQTDI